MHALRIACLCLIALLGAPSLADDAKPRKPNPLFADAEILEVRIAAPFSTIMRERPVDEEMPGQLSYQDAELGEVVLDVGIRTRGKYRQQMKICPFAPLRLNFKKEQTKKTLFTRTNKVKLVTHCRDRSERYSQGVLREFLAYRILNMLTEESFQVRLLRATYVDTSGKEADRVDFAFMIEHDDRLAKRLDMKVSDAPETTIAALNRAHTNLGSVYQYLIGNTDFSPILAAPGEACCHNYVLLNPDDDKQRLNPDDDKQRLNPDDDEQRLNPDDDEQRPQLAVAYDFDMSGIVHARHAKPNPRFNLRDVRERLYRGRCANNEYLESSLQTFRDQRQAINQLVTGSPHMSKGTKKTVQNYIDIFYKTINNPRAVNARLIKKCL